MAKFKELVASNSCNSDLNKGAEPANAAVKKCFKIASVIVLLTIAWGLFTGLIVIYHLPQSHHNSLNGTLSDNNSRAFSSSEANGVAGSLYSGSGDPIESILTCHEGFYPDNETGTCKPECGKWEMFPHEVESTLRVLFIASTVIGAFAGIVVVIISCYRRKQVLGFPTSLVVYVTITIVIAELIVLVGIVKPREVFCSSKNLIESYDNPTTYCTVASILFRYSYAQAGWWWFCHVAAIFLGVRFPFHARTFEKSGRKKYLHIAVVILGFLLPCVPTVVVILKGKFVLDRSPPHVCALESTSNGFYTSAVPYAVFHTAGCTLGIGIFWLLIKERCTGKPINKSMTPEVKVLIMLTYFVGVSILALIATAVNYRQFPEGRGVHELESYFLCESTGVVPGDPPCDRREVKKLYPVQLLYDTAYILLALLPLVHLIFTVNIQELKKGCCKKKIRKTSIDNSGKA